MVRWEPDARGRLGQAAFELFAERGFEQVTVAEIAERAGLTERTFFRYFADKREVLFAGDRGVPGAVRVHRRGRPRLRRPDRRGRRGPVRGGRPVQRAPGRRPAASAIIAAHPELRERELIKLATVAAAVADSLRGRGVSEPAASLTAEAGVAIFKIAFARWIAAPDGPDLAKLIAESLDQLKLVAAGH